MISPPRTFLIKLILFSLPIFLAAVLPLGFAYYVGEIMPVSVAAALRTSQPDFIYGLRFGRDMFTYNSHIINQERPNILVTGSSRSWLFRSEFFNKPEASFYNASDAGWTLRQVDALLHSLQPDSYPDVLLLGIDKPWFNPDFIPLNATSGTDTQNALTITRALLGFVAANPGELAALLARREPVRGEFALGVSAITTGVGVRADGSLQYGEILLGTAPIDAMRAEHLGSLNHSSNMYVAGNEISADTLNQLAALLQFAHERDIQVIGFAPPFAPDIYARMRANGKHQYMWALDPVLGDVFEQYGYRYFDFTNPASVRAVDLDFWDGWHASERVSARMLAQMVTGIPEVLGKYTDAIFLEDAIRQSASPYQLFEHE